MQTWMSRSGICYFSFFPAHVFSNVRSAKAPEDENVWVAVQIREWEWVSEFVAGVFCSVLLSSVLFSYARTCPPVPHSRQRITHVQTWEVWPEVTKSTTQWCAGHLTWPSLLEMRPETGVYPCLLPYMREDDVTGSFTTHHSSLNTVLPSQTLHCPWKIVPVKAFQDLSHFKVHHVVIISPTQINLWYLVGHSYTTIILIVLLPEKYISM